MKTAIVLTNHVIIEDEQGNLELRYKTLDGTLVWVRDLDEYEEEMVRCAYQTGIDVGRSYDGRLERG